jgi:hypothetical protein
MGWDSVAADLTMLPRYLRGETGENPEKLCEIWGTRNDGCEETFF